MMAKRESKKGKNEGAYTINNLQQTTKSPYTLKHIHTHKKNQQNY